MKIKLPHWPLQGRRIAITGAGRGLGRALAIVAADCGADVVLLGRDPSNLQTVADTILTRSKCEALIVPCDLAQRDSIAKACELVLANGSTVDVLINNGAPWLTGELAETTDEDITATVAAAVTGTILVTKGLLPALYRSDAADIVTIVSTSGYLGWDVGGASVAFNAAKHGQSGFSDRLRYEMKERDIRVSALYPPDFEDLDPLDPNWNGPESSKSGNLTNREITSAVLFVITAPRNCSFPVIVMDRTN